LVSVASFFLAGAALAFFTGLSSVAASAFDSVLPFDSFFSAFLTVSFGAASLVSSAAASLSVGLSSISAGGFFVLASSAFLSAEADFVSMVFFFCFA
jgi:hypothetical protein